MNVPQSLVPAAAVSSTPQMMAPLVSVSNAWAQEGRLNVMPPVNTLIPPLKEEVALPRMVVVAVPPTAILP